MPVLSPIRRHFQRPDGDDIGTIEVDIYCLREISIGHPCLGRNDQYETHLGHFRETKR